MFARRQAEIESKSNRDTTRITSRTSIAVAVIAAITALASIAFTYLFTERVRTQISAQTLALETIKADVSKAAQRTAESVAAIDSARLELQRQAASIDAARLDLQRQIAMTSTRNETKRTEIDDHRRKADELRLASEFSKAQTELIPVMDFKCDAEKLQSSQVKLTCRFKNMGIHRITVAPVQFELVDSLTQQVVEHGIAKVDNDVTNTLPVGVEGSNTYDLYLSEAGERLKNQTYRVKVRAQTDPVAVDKLRAIAKGYVSEKDLAILPIQYYVFNLNIK
jgi:hypothetical protein